MTTSQLKGFIRFHKAAYKAYTASKQTKNAQQARARMLNAYIQLRAVR